MPVKASDFVTTSEQKVAASERLLFTEQTDAVNTGIVDSADKKGVSALNGASAVRKAAKAGVSNAVLADTSKSRSDHAAGQGIRRRTSSASSAISQTIRRTVPICESRIFIKNKLNATRNSP